MRRLVPALPDSAPLLVKLLLLMAVTVSSACAVSAERRSQDVSRVVAISDVHGAFGAMQRTLRESGVIGEDGHWRGGKTRLVVTGDLLDRGPQSRAAMDMLMRLEVEAVVSGGQVHVLLGNHEVMNLVGDLRYVSAGEYAAFAADETAEEREYWRQKFIERATVFSTDGILSEQFERAHPAGFFAHRRAFSAEGKYGKWLLGKPLMIVLNETVFVHGGLSPKVAELGLEGTNSTLRNELTNYMAAVKVLTDAAILHPGDSFYTHRKIIEALPVDTVFTVEQQAAIDRLLQDVEPSIHDGDGPLWYRGNVGCPALTEMARLQPVLDALGASRVVIGHTPTASRDVVARLGGRVIEIDTGMLNTFYQGSGHALVMTGDELTVVNERGAPDVKGDDSRPLGQQAMGAEAIEELLATGEVIVGAQRSDGTSSVKVILGDDSVEARFSPIRSRRSAPDVAAYRLDRMLGLEMVPTTVLREVEGRRGALQAIPLQAISEVQRVAANTGWSAWCPLAAQWDTMFVFDTLIQNKVRAQQEIFYDRESWKIFLTGHDDAFGKGRKAPPYLKDTVITVTDAWRNALQELSQERVQETLGDVLDGGQIRALLHRRDNLLESP